MGLASTDSSDDARTQIVATVGNPEKEDLEYSKSIMLGSIFGASELAMPTQARRGEVNCR
jgi:hypothetical protein